MCDYLGYEFGAGLYPDSYCIDGSLHDADSDFLNDEDIPCPICRKEEAITWWADLNNFYLDDDYDEIGEQKHKTRALERARLLVKDIRKNRGLSDDLVEVPR